MDSSVQQDIGDSAVVRAPRPDVTIRSDDDRSAIGFTEQLSDGCACAALSTLNALKIGGSVSAATAVICVELVVLKDNGIQ